MKMGIIGYKGFVGSALYKFFSSQQNFNITGIGKENYLLNVGEFFDIIINADGNASKILAEREPKKDFEMNVVSTLNSLIDFKYDKYIYLSSVDVYKEKDKQDKTTEDCIIEPQYLSNYGLSKYCAEQIVKKYAKKWLILRLGGMVGENMKKGPVFDILNLHKLFLSSKSIFQFINTAEVAKIINVLIQKQKWGEIYNIVGRENIALNEIASLAGIKLTEEGNEKIVLDVSCEKIKKLIKIPTTKETIQLFLAKE